MFIDTHCHLSLEYYDDIDSVLKENEDNGIVKMIVSGCDKDSIQEVLGYAEKYDNIYLTIGFHPSEVLYITNSDLELLKVQLKNRKVVGIGEIGLDYHYGKDNIDRQKELFRSQMQIAKDLSLPVVIHSRDATLDTINILKEFPSVKGVIHCFSGSYETAITYISMGYKLGIGGVLTFKNSNLFKVVKSVGIESIVLETDSPYLTPEPYRGKVNSSKYIPLIAEKVGELLDLSIEDVSKNTIKNTLELFDLKL